MNPANKTIDILLPNNVTNLSGLPRQLCELFVGRILDYDDNEINVEIDTISRNVISNSKGVKEALSLFIAAGHFYGFREALTSLLHKKDFPGKMGEVHCKYDARELILEILEENKSSKIIWKINKVKVV